MSNYLEVPKILTCKDLDYLSDMFDWNLLSLKKCSESVQYVEDEEIEELLQKGIDLFNNHLNLVLNILGEENNDGE